MTDRVDNRIDRFFSEGPSGGTPDGLAAALTRTRSVGQRRHWFSAGLGDRSIRMAALPAIGLAFLLLIAAATAVVGALLIAEAPRRESVLVSVSEVLTRFDPLDRSSRQVAVTGRQEFVEYPQFSPDGTKVAFWSAASFDRPVDLIVADSDLTDRQVVIAARTFHDPSPIAWSPDGTQLAVTGSAKGGRSQIYVVGIDGTGWHAIVPDMDVESAAWSPDGAWIAMRATSPDQSFIAIYVVHPDGSDPHSIIRSKGVDWWAHKLSALSWSPDGREMAFTWYGDTTFTDGASFAATWTIVAVIDMETGRARALTDHATDVAPVWSPDGERIAFVRVGTDQAMTIRPDGTDIQEIADGPKPASLVWSPDGSHLAMVAGDDNRLLIAGMDGSPARDTGITGVVTRPTWTLLP